jgi:hypothetical protein
MNQQQPETETLTFKIGISGLYWDKNPQYSIHINKDTILHSIIKSPSNQIVYHEFTYTLESDQEFNLEIRLLNKTDSDTVQDSEKNIVKDMILNIESIEIDGIELEFLKWSESVFTPENPTKPTLKNCVNLGWNGAYKLSLTSPFYLWLLEKM